MPSKVLRFGVLFPFGPLIDKLYPLIHDSLLLSMLGGFMTMFRYCLLAALTVLSLSACQPQYTLDQTDFYARKLGVTHQFDIYRQNNWALAGKSRLYVVSEPKDDADMQLLCEVIAKGLQPYFQQVDVEQHARSIPSAAKIARKGRADFAVYVQVVETRPLVKNEASNDSADYHRLRILLTIVDANSGNVVDKIQLLARSSHFSLFGEDMQSLLEKPIAHIGRDLSGVR
jgi:Domain of unknown function (DUF4823)